MITTEELLRWSFLLFSYRTLSGIVWKVLGIYWILFGLVWEFGTVDSASANLATPAFRISVVFSDNCLIRIPHKRKKSISNLKLFVNEQRGKLIGICDMLIASDETRWYYIQIAGKYFGVVSARYIERE